jgi:hypothetical protein
MTDSKDPSAGSAFQRLALAGFKAWVRLVDDIDPALTTHETVVAVTTTQRFQRVLDFHSANPGLADTSPTEKHMITQHRFQTGPMPYARRGGSHSTARYRAGADHTHLLVARSAGVKHAIHRRTSVGISKGRRGHCTPERCISVMNCTAGRGRSALVADPVHCPFGACSASLARKSGSKVWLESLARKSGSKVWLENLAAGRSISTSLAARSCQGKWINYVPETATLVGAAQPQFAGPVRWPSSLAQFAGPVRWPKLDDRQVLSQLQA